MRVVIGVMVLLAAVVLPRPAVAQATSASVRATVVDPQGRVVPSAVVTLRNVATGVVREGTATADGGVVVVAAGRLHRGTAAPGFGATAALALTLNSGDARGPCVSCCVARRHRCAGHRRLGRVQTSPSVGTVITQEFIANMPLSGRTLQSLFDLTPGVVRTAPGTGCSRQWPASRCQLLHGGWREQSVNASAFAAGPGHRLARCRP
jgi:hypothetical protein